MKKLLFIASVVTLASQTHAAVIQWGSGGGRGNIFVIDTVSMARVPDGSLIRVGYFEDAGNVSSPFIEFGTTTMASPTGTIGGHIPSAGRNVIGADTFAGRQLYIWVYNASTAATATAQEIFTSVAWTTPGNFNTPDATFPLVVGQAAAPIVAVTNRQGPLDLLPGSYGQGSVTIGATTNNFASVYALSVIPEPTTSLMASIAGLALLARRRR